MSNWKELTPSEVEQENRKSERIEKVFSVVTHAAQKKTLISFAKVFWFFGGNFLAFGYLAKLIFTF